MPDPNDLPFSNRARQGFENKIIELVAKDLGAGVTYLWWPQRRGYIRKTLNASKCDVWPGIATGVDRAATTSPVLPLHVRLRHARECEPRRS